jgi:hypothetical protein
MTDEKEEIITIEWEAHCFRRHVPNEYNCCVELIAGDPVYYTVFVNLVKSANAGICVCPCTACQRKIFGGQALGGFFMFHSVSKLPVEGSMEGLAPICRDCAWGDLDILRSRCLKTLPKGI